MNWLNQLPTVLSQCGGKEASGRSDLLINIHPYYADFIDTTESILLTNFSVKREPLPNFRKTIVCYFDERKKWIHQRKGSVAKCQLTSLHKHNMSYPEDRRQFCDENTDEIGCLLIVLIRLFSSDKLITSRSVRQLWHPLTSCDSCKCGTDGLYQR